MARLDMRLRGQALRQSAPPRPSASIAGKSRSRTRRMRAAVAGSAKELAVNDHLALEVAGVHLRRVAQSQGVTQKELARRLKVNASVISRIFKHPERSTLQTLQRIADALGASVRDVLPD